MGTTVSSLLLFQAAIRDSQENCLGGVWRSSSPACLCHWQPKLDPLPSHCLSQLKGPSSWCAMGSKTALHQLSGDGQNNYTPGQNYITRGKKRNKKKKTPSARQEGLSGFFSPPFREEALHHMGSYREVSGEARLTFTAHWVPALLPAQRYELFNSRC